MSEANGTANEGPIVDAEVVDETPPPQPVTTPHGAALVAREVRNEVLMPLDAEQVVAGMEAYQRLLPRLLVESDYQQTRDGKFVKKIGWRKIARAFNLSLEIVQTIVERDAEGQPVRAHTIARAIGPNGSFQDADGYCAAEEPRFAQQGGRQKLENDLRATATTRAKNRAISDLVGMGEVSAEEVDVGEASDELKARASRALTYILGEDAAEVAWAAIKGEVGGRMTDHAAKALVTTASKLQEQRGQGQARAVTAKPPQATEETASAAQQRGLHQLARDAGVVDEQVHKALYLWTTGSEHSDRIPKAKVAAAREALKDVDATLDEITSQANEGDERAQQIVARFLGGQAELAAS